MLNKSEIELCIELLESILKASIDDDAHGLALRSYIAALNFSLKDSMVEA